MFDTNNPEHGIYFATLHNMNMLLVYAVTGEPYQKGKGFIAVDGKIPIPSTMPAKMIDFAKKQLGNDKVWVINLTAGDVSTPGGTPIPDLSKLIN